MTRTRFGAEHGWELQVRSYADVYPTRWVVYRTQPYERERDATDEEVTMWLALPEEMTR